MKRRLIIAVTLALSTQEASGETYHLKSPSTVETDKGSRVRLPPGYFLDEQSWQERDAELKRLQEQETRLKAENKSLRKSGSEYPWVATGTVLVFGIAFGALAVIAK